MFIGPGPDYRSLIYTLPTLSLFGLQLEPFLFIQTSESVDRAKNVSIDICCKNWFNKIFKWRFIFLFQTGEFFLLLLN